jgi:hypothetical protein
VIARLALALALVAASLGVSGASDPAAQPSAAAEQPAAAVQPEAVGELPAAESAVVAPPDPALPAPPLLEAADDGNGWLLSADFEMPLTHSLAEAVNLGVPLYFIVEFELRRPRWWWLDAVVAERALHWRLAYHALTRQYRLTLQGVIQPFNSLDEALRTVAQVRGWRVIEAGQVTPGVEYDAQVRLRLDASQLPKPFQISGLTNRDWNPQAEWQRFTFTPQTPKSAR